MSFVKEFVDTYGMTIVYAILTAIVGFFAAKIKAIYEERVTDRTKREVVETCVNAAEQLYRDLSGVEKLERAKANIVLMLNNKGIEITELEMDMLIEAVVAGFNQGRDRSEEDDIQAVDSEV